MKLNKIVLVLMFSFVLLFGNSREQININFKGLQIIDLIKITSRIINKNILLSTKVNGKVDFISNTPVYKDDILNILTLVLEEKGYTIVENGNILRVVRINDASKYNLPIYTKKANLKTNKLITEIFTVQNSDVDYVSAKIRHFMSKSAKLVTDKKSNSIMITDFTENIKTIKKVIGIISKDTQKTIRTVTLKNIQANIVINDLKNVAKTVFNEKIEKERVSLLLNKNTNSIMFVGKKKNVDFLIKYLLDIEKKGSLVEKVVEVIYLKNAEAKGVMSILNGVIANKKYKNTNNKPFASIDEESNSIILMGQKEKLKYFTQLIKKLDIDRQQVYVQARIIEISEKKIKDVGIKYGLFGGKSGNNGLLTFSTKLAESGSNALAVDLSKFGVSSPTGLTKGLALGATINLLNQNGAADIVSEPSLLCINNKASSIYVGQTVSIKTSKTNGTTSTESFSREDVGLTLKVKPRISNGGKVLLEISTKVEDVTKTDGANAQPETSKKELETTAIVNNGESVILGGYIKATKGNTVDKVPFFGDIPILGTLFRSKREVNDKINLVIIITPYIVPKSKDLTYIRNQLAQLKLLEDKYTKDAILRLEKARIQQKKEDKNRIKELKKIIKNETKKTKQKKSISNETLQEQKIKEMFGI
jgi:general secretion pathway protein D